MSLPLVKIYTDGSCSPNPGIGGWGAVLIYGQDGSIHELYGGEPETTNNRMELTGAINALASLAQPYSVTLYTDSQYLQKGITVWLVGWKRVNWRTMDGEPVKNKDLWMMLDQLIHYHTIAWEWIKGHRENQWNHRADELAAQGRCDWSSSSMCFGDGLHLYCGVTWSHVCGSGAWSVILNYKKHYKILYGCKDGTTANELYLLAFINGLNALKKKVHVFVHTQSGYLADGYNFWLRGWIKRGWITRDGASVKNTGYWKEIVKLSDQYDISVVSVDKKAVPCHLFEAKEIAKECRENKVKG